MLTPRNRPTASLKVSVQDSTCRSGCVDPSGRRLTGRTLESFLRKADAIEPISVCIPVAKTTPLARPLVTVELLYATLRRSPGPVSSSKTASSSLATGSDSPVSSASSVSKLSDSINLNESVVSVQVDDGELTSDQQVQCLLVSIRRGLQAPTRRLVR